MARRIHVPGARGRRPRGIAVALLLALVPLGAAAQSSGATTATNAAAACSASAAEQGNGASPASLKPSGQAAGLDIGGNLQEGALLLQNLSPASTPSLAGSSVLTLNFENRNRSFAKVSGSVQLNLLYGSYADAYAAAVTQAIGPTAAPGLLSLLETQGAAATINLQKLYLEVFTQNADISMGREIINFGVGTLFSPIDAFSEPELTNLNFTRSGSDVLRVDVPFGAVSGAEAVTTLSDSLNTLVSALKLYTNIDNTDFAAVTLYRGSGEELLLGGDFSGTLIAGIYGEAVEHLFLDGQASYFEGMLGTNYLAGNSLVFTVEYYYNGDPVAPGSLSPTQAAAATPIFLNRNYLYGSARYLLNGVMSLSGSLVYDLSAGSTLATLQYDWNLVQNADLLFYVRSIEGDIRSGGSYPGPNLEYGFQLTVSF